MLRHGGLCDMKRLRRAGKIHGAADRQKSIHSKIEHRYDHSFHKNLNHFFFKLPFSALS